MKNSIILYGVVCACAAVVRGDLGCADIICDILVCRVHSCPAGQTLMPRAGFCECCPECIIELDEGEVCDETVYLGVPPRRICREGLVCSLKSKTCAISPYR